MRPTDLYPELWILLMLLVSGLIGLLISLVFLAVLWIV